MNIDQVRGLVMLVIGVAITLAGGYMFYEWAWPLIKEGKYIGAAAVALICSALIDAAKSGG